MEAALIAICLLLLLSLAIQTPQGSGSVETPSFASPHVLSPRDRARLAVRALLRSLRER